MLRELGNFIYVHRRDFLGIILGAIIVFLGVANARQRDRQYKRFENELAAVQMQLAQIQNGPPSGRVGQAFKDLTQSAEYTYYSRLRMIQMSGCPAPDAWWVGSRCEAMYQQAWTDYRTAQR